MLSLTWGGYTSQDQKILAYCGFTYASYKIDFGSDPLQLLELDGRNWKQIPDFHPLEAFFNGLNLNHQFVDDLLHEIGSRDHGGMFEL